MEFEFKIIPLTISVIVAFACGTIGARIAGRREGCLGAIILGFTGSYLGQLLAEKLSLTEVMANIPIPIPLSFDIAGEKIYFFWNIVGAAAFMALMNLVWGPPKSK